MSMSDDYVDIQKIVFDVCERENGGCACKVQGVNLAKVGFGAQSRGSRCDERYSVALNVALALAKTDTTALSASAAVSPAVPEGLDINRAAKSLASGATPTVPAIEGEAQNAINDVALGDPYPIATILKGIRQRSIQALHAGISRRDWHATEAAANESRDAIDRLLIRMGERP